MTNKKDCKKSGDDATITDGLNMYDGFIVRLITVWVGEKCKSVLVWKHFESLKEMETVFTLSTNLCCIWTPHVRCVNQKIVLRSCGDELINVGSCPDCCVTSPQMMGMWKFIFEQSLFQRKRCTNNNWRWVGNYLCMRGDQFDLRHCVEEWRCVDNLRRACTHVLKLTVYCSQLHHVGFCALPV